MSRKNDAPNDVESAKKYIKWLASLGIVERVFIAGSRSPLREKIPHEHSDWDFVIQTKIKNLKLISPRSSGMLHADLLILNDVSHQRKIAEIWPKDKHGILNGLTN